MNKILRKQNGGKHLKIIYLIKDVYLAYIKNIYNSIKDNPILQ